MAPILVTLRVVDGPDRGKVFTHLRPTISIGREEGNTVQLRDDRASRCHAKIHEDAGEILITDLDSTNGTWVNGEPVRIAPLRNGDRITIGRSLLVISLVSEGATAGAGEPGSMESDFLLAGEAEPGESPTPQYDSARAQVPDASSPTPAAVHPFQETAPPLPEGLSPGQNARLARIFDHIHCYLQPALWHSKPAETGEVVSIPVADWEHVLKAASLVSMYYRQLVEPE